MKEKSKNERYAEKWFKTNDFKYKLVKQYISKTVWEISKDGLTYRWELPYDVSDIHSYMKWCNRNHNMLVELNKLRKEVKH